MVQGGTSLLLGQLFLAARVKGGDFASKANGVLGTVACCLDLFQAAGNFGVELPNANE